MAASIFGRNRVNYNFKEERRVKDYTNVFTILIKSWEIKGSTALPQEWSDMHVKKKNNLFMSKNQNIQISRVLRIILKYPSLGL